MSDIDLRHLRIFLALFATKHVTRAAESLGLSQSGISVVLGQLRSHYNDPLFVRTSGGMQPTPRAQSLEPLLRQSLQLLDESQARTPEFVPGEVIRHFRICMTDVGQMTLLPRLVSRLQRVAPNITVETANLSHETARQLEQGEVDLAMGFTQQINAGFYQQKLFDEGFVCVVARDHPRVRDSMSITQFREEKHVKALLSSTAHFIVDKFMERNGVERAFVLSVPTFLGLGQVVASSELLAVVPLRLGTIFAAEGNVRIVELPITLPSYPVKQYWHHRYHRDPGNTWLRSLVYEVATGLPLTSRPPTN